MALDSFDNLKAAIKTWSHRDEIVGQLADDCVTMAEQEIFYGATPMRLIEMVAEDITAATTKNLALPDDLLEIRNVSIEVDDCYYRLRNIPLQQMPDRGDEEGVPSAYSITSGLVFDVIPDQSYNIKVEYYAKPSALSSASPTNIVLQKYPTAYLFGGIAAALLYAKEDEMASEYTIRMRDVIARANSDAEALSYGSMPTVFIDGCLP